MKADKNPQRYYNFWEPIYDPKIDQFDLWETNGQTLLTNPVENINFNINYFNEIKGNKLYQITFNNVDLNGDFIGKQIKFTFEKCIFNNCSLRKATFSNVKFNKCEFIKTSFSYAKFINCEFRDCVFKKIGISSNATFFENIYIDPSALLNDLYLVRDQNILKEKNSDFLNQWYKLESTKSFISRKLTTMPLIQQNIDFHIKSIKLSRKYEILSLMKKTIFLILKGNNNQKLRHCINLIYYILEYPTIMFFGWLSGWGNKIGKTLFYGALTLMLFSLLNHILIFNNDSILSSIMQTTEYWLLFGYTKYDFSSINNEYEWVVFLNSVIGMIWFAALIPIIINKLGNNNE